MKNKILDGLKALLFWVLCYGAIQAAAGIPKLPMVSQLLAWSLAVTVFAWGLTHFLLKIEGQTLQDLGIFKFNHFFRNVFWGSAWGILILAFMFGTLLSLTNLFIEQNPNTVFMDFLIQSIPIIFVLALLEEVVFRGYPLFKLKQAIGVRGAIYVTSVLFGLNHGLSFDAAFGPTMFGLIFGLMALWSKSLVLPTAFHFMVNWIQTIFGMKTQYTEGLLVLKIDESIQRIPFETVGLTLSILIGLTGLILIEVYIKKNKNDHLS